MASESEFLRSLLGRRVRIVIVDEQNLPPLRPLVLKEVSSLGVAAADDRTTHFFPWNEIVEITPVPEPANQT